MNGLVKVLSESLIKVLREFGVIGVITYVAGLISLASLFFVNEFSLRILFSVVGVLLFGLAAVIALVRIKAQQKQENALIEMVTNSSNRLAERINENVQKEQITSITQTIWQTQKDLMGKILEDGDKK